MSRPDLRRHAVFGVVLVALAAGFGVWTWSDQLASLGGDSAVYVLTARAYAPYMPASEVASELARNSLFPPLYPVLLALSGGAADLHLAHAATTLALVAAFAGLYAWLVAIGVSSPLATVGVAAFALLPGTLTQSLHLQSESLYLAFALWSLAVLARALRSGRTTLWWLAGGLIAAALLTRAAGLALLAAYAVALWRGRPRGALLMLAAAVAPSIAWSLWHRPARSYSGSMLSMYAQAGPAEFWRRLSENATAIYDGILMNWLQTTSLMAIVVALVVVSAVAALVRVRRMEPDAWYAAAYLAMLVLWPFPGESVRFAWVLVPLLIGFVLSAVGVDQAPAPALRKALPWAVTACLALIAIPSGVLNLQRFLHPVGREYPVVRALPEWYDADIRDALKQAQTHVGFVGALQHLGREIPEGDCVLSIKPALVMFYTGRRSVAPPLPSVDAAAFAAGLKASSCGFALLLPAASPTYRVAYYPMERLEPAVEVVAERTVWSDGAEVFKAHLVALHGAGR